MKYEVAKDLYNRKRGKYRSLGCYNYMHSDYVNGEVVYVLYNGKPEPDTWSERAGKFMTIYPDDTIEFHCANPSWQGLRNDIGRYTGYYLIRRARSAASHNYFLRGHGVDTPMFDGLKVRNGEVLNSTALKVRTVNKERAKEFKEKLSTWRKVLETTAHLCKGEYGANHSNCEGKYGITYWELRTGRFPFPSFDDPVDGAAAMRMLSWAHLRTETTEVAIRGSYDSTSGVWTPAVMKEKETYMKNLIGKIINKLRDNWYSDNDVYDWKEAA